MAYVIVNLIAALHSHDRYCVTPNFFAGDVVPMFWVIFDTSTKRDYYRDVHNLLALPPGGTIRYDYHRVHLSQSAVAQADADPAARPISVLLAYAQNVNFRKGGADPIGAMQGAESLWVSTRLANLRYLSRRVDRYDFDLEVAGYPVHDRDTLMRILGPLIGAAEVPFSKWVAISNAHADLDLLSRGSHSENWSATVDAIGAPPSQFAGDSFWRVARILNGRNGAPVTPELEQRTTLQSGQSVITGVYAVYPVRELNRIALEIESRTPGPGSEPATGEPTVPRRVSFETLPDGPLAGMNGRTLLLRRYAIDRVDSEVAGTDRIEELNVDLRVTTGPDAGGFPIGPELTLRFRVGKQPGRGYFALLLAVVGVIAAAVGADVVKDHPEIGVLVIGLGILSGLVAAYCGPVRSSCLGRRNNGDALYRSEKLSKWRSSIENLHIGVELK